MIARVQCENEGGAGRGHAGDEIFCVGMREINMVCNLLCQYEDQSWVPVWFPVPQGTEETRSEDISGVCPCDHNYNPYVDSTVYLSKEFLEILRYESTQVCEYN